MLIFLANDTQFATHVVRKHLQRIVKKTCWSDYVSRVELLLSFLDRHAKIIGYIANVLIILHHLTKLHAFMGKVKNA